MKSIYSSDTCIRAKTLNRWFEAHLVTTNYVNMMGHSWVHLIYPLSHDLSKRGWIDRRPSSILSISDAIYIYKKSFSIFTLIQSFSFIPTVIMKGEQVWKLTTQRERATTYHTYRTVITATEMCNYSNWMFL